MDTALASARRLLGCVAGELQVMLVGQVEEQSAGNGEVEARLDPSSHRREDRHPGENPDPPGHPRRSGRDARRESGYKRHGTVSVIAAMNVATGDIVASRIRRNDSVTFMSFLLMLDQSMAPGLRIHLIMDNGSSHTSKATGPGSPRTRDSA